MASLGQAEVNHRAQAAEETWLRAVIACECTGKLLVSTRALIDESRRLLATIQARRADAVVANSRALIDESRQLLAVVQGADLPLTPHPTSPPEAVTVIRCSDGASVNPAVHHSDRASMTHRASLSVRVFREGARFGWSVFGPSREMLGQGIAETELKARTDALGAGMIYIERLKRRSRPTDGSVH